MQMDATPSNVAMAEAAERRAQAAYDRAAVRLGEAAMRLFEALRPLGVTGATESDMDAAIVARGAEAAARQDALRAAKLWGFAKHAVIAARMRNAGIVSEQAIAEVLALCDGNRRRR